MSDDLTSVITFMPPSIVPYPGQLWKWALGVEGAGWWAFDRVTSNSNPFDVRPSVMVQRGALFLLIILDYVHPPEIINIDWNNLESREKKRWHVAMLDDVLFWINHDSLINCAELVCDVG